MPIDTWLKNLPDDTAHSVQIDLEVLNTTPYPFLEAGQVAYQIERLSSHLGSQPSHIRQAAISYSLYVRQLDALQEKGNNIREICAHDCQRPPIGCCNSEHHVILSCSDFLIARPTPNTLHLAHVLTTLQNLEHAHALQQGRLPRPSCCSHLTATGCTLRLLKSPRCIHYICPQVALAMIATYGDNAADFLAAMHDTGNRVILTMKDFTNPEVIQAAASMFLMEAPLAQS